MYDSLSKFKKGFFVFFLFCGCAQRYEPSAPVEYPQEQDSIEEDENVEVQPLEPIEEETLEEKTPKENFNEGKIEKIEPLKNNKDDFEKKSKNEKEEKKQRDKEDEIKTSSLIWPIKGKIITHFGDHSNRKEDSNSITIQAAPNLRIKAVSSGKVTQVTFLPDIGKVVILDHQDGKFSVYSSLKEASVKKGASIKQGDIIGRTDRKPFSFRLYERKKGKKVAVDPLKYLP